MCGRVQTVRRPLVVTDSGQKILSANRRFYATFKVDGTTRKALHVIDYDEGIRIVNFMKGEFDGLFGLEKDQGFKTWQSVGLCS